jgi:predicted DNA-binding transcriptional regulator AlpA
MARPPRTTKTRSLQKTAHPTSAEPSSGISAGIMDMLRVLTKAEAAQLAGVSEDTLDRLIKFGDGPRCVQLSARRVGIVLQDFSAWLASRPLTTGGA